MSDIIAAPAGDQAGPAEPQSRLFQDTPAAPPWPGGDTGLLDTGLLDAVGAAPADRVLVVGGSTADLLCASARRGCRSALGVTTLPRHPEAAEVVIAPQVCSLAQADAIAGRARVALGHGTHEGRLLVRLLGLGAGGMARTLAAHLRALGYGGVRARRVGRQAVVVVGRFAAMPLA